jgi:hypothetical protein
MGLGIRGKIAQEAQGSGLLAFRSHGHLEKRNETYLLTT